MKLQQFLKGRNLTLESKSESKQSKCDNQSFSENEVDGNQLENVKAASKLDNAKQFAKTESGTPKQRTERLRLAVKRDVLCGEELSKSKSAAKRPKRTLPGQCVKWASKSEKVRLAKKNNSPGRKESEFTCKECQAIFIRKGALAAHLRIHNGHRPYFCTECGVSFARNYSLSIHMRKHSGEKPFKCPECAATFSQSVHLQRHLRRHTGERPYKCTECGDCFRQAGGLQQHIRSHTGAKPYTCQFCEKAFSRSYSLRVHEVSHSDVKPFKCTVCGDRFTQRGNLQVHMRRHSGEKPHICLECGKAFAHSQSLQVHLRVHSGMRPYQCKAEGCKATFADSGSLYKHRLIHSNIMPHVCEFCNARFAQRANMKRHVRVMHGKTVGPAKRGSVAKIQDNSSKSKLPKVKSQLKKRDHAKLNKQFCTVVKPLKSMLCNDNFTQREALKSPTRNHCSENRQMCIPDSSNVISQAVNKEQENLTLHQHSQHAAEQLKCTVCRDRFVVQICLHCLGSEKQHFSKPSNETSQAQDNDPARQELPKHTRCNNNLLKCTVCKDSFTCKEDLQIHMDCHSREQSRTSSTSSNEVSQAINAEQGRRQKQKMPKKKVIQ